jgi:hypothetical protein
MEGKKIKLLLIIYGTIAVVVFFFWRELKSKPYENVWGKEYVGITPTGAQLLVSFSSWTATGTNGQYQMTGVRTDLNTGNHNSFKDLYTIVNENTFFIPSANETVNIRNDGEYLETNRGMILKRLK